MTTAKTLLPYLPKHGLHKATAGIRLALLVALSLILVACNSGGDSSGGGNGNNGNGGDTKDTKAPTLKSGGNALAIDKAARTFTVTFNEAMKLKDGVSDIKPLLKVLKDSGADSLAIKTAVLSADTTQLIITLADSVTVGDGSYKVTIGANALTDTAGNPFLPAETESDTIDSSAKDTTPPTFKKAADGTLDALTINRATKTLIVTFSEQMKFKDGITDKDLRNENAWEVEGSTGFYSLREPVTLSTDKTQLIIKPFAVVLGDGGYTVKIVADFLTDLAGNKFAGGTTEVEILDTTPPTARSLAADAASKVLTVRFSDPLTAVDTSTITVNKAGEANPITGGVIANSGYTITITYANALKSGTYTVEIGTGGVTSIGGATTQPLTAMGNVVVTHVGTTGNDNFAGDSGDDIYVFAVDSGFGADTIADTGGTADTVRFESASAISLFDIQESLTGTTLKFTYKASSITIANWASGVGNAANKIEKFALKVGSTATTYNLLVGTNTVDTLTGTANSDVVFALGGADTISGEAGDDVLSGGAGGDTLTGGAGDDTIAGGTDNDTLEGQADNDDLIGGAGNDTLTGDGGNDILTGGAGDDTLDGGADGDTLTGGAGDDTLTGGAANDTYIFDLAGQSGSDSITDSTGSDTIFLTKTTAIDAGSVGIELISGDKLRITYNSTDTITINDWSTKKVETLSLDNNGDRVADSAYDIGGESYTLSSRILLDAVTLKALLISTTGNDGLKGTSGDDTYIFNVDSAFGADTITDAGGTADTIRFESTSAIDLRDIQASFDSAGTDLTFTYKAGKTGSSSITIADWASNKIEKFAIKVGSTTTTYDLVIGTNGKDRLFVPDRGGTMFFAFGGNDRFVGTVDGDVVYGGTGNDELYGQLNNDVLVGGAGNDTLGGAIGNDTLDGGTGNDALNGGEGDDYYIFDLAAQSGADTIEDTAGDDTLLLTSTTTINASSVGIVLNSEGTLVITYNTSDTITIDSWSLNQVENLSLDNNGDGVADVSYDIGTAVFTSTSTALSALTPR